MIFYQHNIGDYTRDAAHLSMVEDGAYHRLLARYYMTEKELPLDVKEICRLIRARTKVEKKAVEKCLNEFFFKSRTGYRNNRADQEIEKYKKKSLNAREKSLKRWMPQHSHSIATAKPQQSHGNAINNLDIYIQKKIKIKKKYGESGDL